MFSLHSRSQQYFDKSFVEWSDCRGEQADEKADKHVISQPRIHKRVKRYPNEKNGSNNSFIVFTTSGRPIHSMKLIRSQHKIGVLNSIKHSRMPLFTQERFQQSVLQESSDTIKRCCLKDQKSQRKYQKSNQMSVHRVTDCLTRINVRKSSSSSEIVFVSLKNFRTEMSFSKNYSSIKAQYGRRHTHSGVVHEASKH